MISKQVNITESVEIMNNRVRPFSGQRRYLATGDLTGDEISGIASVDYETKPSRADLLVNEGDIIVARMQATNKVLLIDKTNKDLIVSTGFLTLKPQKGFDHTYLTHFFRSEIFQRQKDQYCSGATQKAINNGAFEKIFIPSHPLVEQKKIAEVLDCADTLRQKRKQSLQLLGEFLRSTFLDMFGNPLSSKKKYDLAKLGSLVNFVGGGTPSRKNSAYYEGNNLWATSKDMKGIVLANTQERITNEALAESATKLVNTGTVLVVVKSKILLRYLPVMIAGKKLCFNQDIKGIIPGEKVDPWYLLFHMRIGQNALLQIARGANTEGLTLDHLRNYDLILAPIDAQKRFAEIAKSYMAMVEKMNQSKMQMDNQFNVLIQKYFS